MDGKPSNLAELSFNSINSIEHKHIKIFFLIMIFILFFMNNALWIDTYGIIKNEDLK